ncbi:MAG: Zn-dependent hydrolase [Spirochaetae bacterium HGW-Spirochaetae-5]|nr:MAG: Zn-dependent hydrolase [Spirochaetae bacterium HGW-Spirochaetae-5]
MKYKFNSFTLHQLDGHIADLYIAEYQNSLLLLDCGCRSDHSLIVTYITEILERPMDHLKLLIVTHLHPDHSGSAMSLSKKYSIPIAAPEEINLWYAGIRGTMQHMVDSLLAHIAARRRKMKMLRVSYPKKIAVNFPLKDMSLLPGFPDWQVYSIPGHTEHDIVLYNKRESFLYCSDTVVKIRDKYLSPFPVTDKIKMSKNLSRIMNLKVESIAMAHGGFSKIENFSELISYLIKELDTPLTGILKIFYPLTLFPKPLKK